MILLSVFFISMSVVVWKLGKLILWVYWSADMTANIPGPKPYPIIGNALMLSHAKTRKDMFQMFYHLLDSADEIYKISKLWIGPKLVVFIGNPKHIQTVLSSPYALEKDSVYDYLGLFANGVTIKNGEDWKELRKPLNKHLSKNVLIANHKMFCVKALKLCKVLEKQAITGEEVEIKNFVMNFYLDILSVSNFGYDINEIEKNRYQINILLESGFEKVFKMMLLFPHSLSIFYAKMSHLGRETTRECKRLWRLSQEMLHGREVPDYLMRNSKLNSEEDGHSQSLYSDILLRKAERDNLSWEDTAKLVSDFLIAGTDTPAVILSSTLLMIAMHSEHQEAVYQEQIDIMGENTTGAPELDQLSKMPYLTKMLKEVLRIHCPPAIVRRLSKDIDLGEYKLPDGSTTFLLFYSLHRNPKFWSHPDEFYPDHFSPEEVASRPKRVYFPFSWGPRGCAGVDYAMGTMKILISALIRKYRLETDLKYDQLKYKYGLLLEFEQGCRIRFISR